ncbi:FRG domain-containing protein [Paenibacillus sp. LPE1-1-1.1]|uniref:FRG domain-containing protein n=1 Tax=Paenibacillus sp. LPE1-1-1.1 TaxID=3135230 RepID=UPI00342F7749
MTFSNEWHQVLDIVNENNKKSPMIWYRGHSDEKLFKLHSGLFRESADLPSVNINEASKYRMFYNLGHNFHNSKDWDLLFIMQHHGVKTRLLDWTESFSTALYFAFTSWNPNRSNACVWMLNPVVLNNKSLGFYGFADVNRFGKYEHYLNNQTLFANNSSALYPIRNSQRIIAQQGVFTLQGNSGVPLDEEFNGELLAEHALIKITITPSVYYDAKNYLYQNGIGHFRLFPDLDGLAKYANNPMLAFNHI